MRIFLSLAALGLIASAVTAGSPTQSDREAKQAAVLEKALIGKVAGKPTGCITLSRVSSSQTISENAIIYRESSNKLYVNTPRGGCSGLRDGRTLITRTPSNRLCSGDIARVVDLSIGFEGASCVLGEFTPYTKIRG